MRKFVVGFALLLPALCWSLAVSQSIKGADLALLDDVRLIAARVEEFLGEKYDRRPVAVRVTEPMREVAATIRAQSVLSSARLEARGRAWSDIGLGGVGSPNRLLSVLAADLKGVGFDPQGNRLLVSPDLLTGDDFDPKEGEDRELSTVLLMTGVRPDEPLVGHFLVHVRQIERSGRDSLDETTDRLLARTAWAEGEANLLSVRYLFEGMGLADDVLDVNFDPGAILDTALLPPQIETLDGPEGDFLRFVYQEGFARAVEEYKAGGWNQLRQAVSRRTLTRDLLHRGGGSGVAEFTEPRPPAATWKLADQDSLGEQAVVVLVSRLTGKDNLGLMAGDGWAGDRLYRWEQEGRESAGITEWMTRWSSVEAAKDFEYAFWRCISARFPKTERIDGEGRSSLTADGRRFRVERRDKSVNLRIEPVAASN